METRSGGGDGSFFLGEGGLVAIAVGAVAFAVHVVRQGELAVGFFIDFLVPADDAIAIFENAFDGAGGSTNFDGAARFHFFAGTNEAFPFEWAKFVGADEFDFIVVRKESGRGDFGIVEDEEVVGAEIGRKISKHAVFDFAGIAVNHHHTRGRSVVEWTAGNEFFGEVIVEISGAQRVAKHDFTMMSEVFSFKCGMMLCRMWLCRMR
jgi:hypothetical protein